MQDLDREIEKLQSYIAAFKQVNNIFDNTCEYELSKEDYYKLCMTQFSNSDKIGKLLTKTFPFLSYKHDDADYYVYEAEGDLTVRIPKINYKSVEIFVNEYYPSTERIKSDVNAYYSSKENINRKAIADAEYFITEKSVLKRARFLSPCDSIVYSLLYYQFGSFPKDYRKNCRDKLSELCKERDSITADKQEYYSNVTKKRQIQQTQIRKCASGLLEWTDTIDVYEKAAGRTCHKMHFCIQNGSMSVSEL